MTECCCQQTKTTQFFWDWFKEKERTFTVDEVAALLEKVKQFNAGCIDEYLSRHVDKVFKEWAENLP